jgi:hypothetical protein
MDFGLNGVRQGSIGKYVEVEKASNLDELKSQRQGARERQEHHASHARASGLGTLGGVVGGIMLPTTKEALRNKVVRSGYKDMQKMGVYKRPEATVRSLASQARHSPRTAASKVGWGVAGGSAAYGIHHGVKAEKAERDERYLGRLVREQQRQVAKSEITKIAMFRPTMGSRMGKIGLKAKTGTKNFATRAAGAYTRATPRQRMVGAFGIGAGLGAGTNQLLQPAKQRVMKRSRDPETKRQRRLENYQTGLVGGGLIAGTAGLTSYAGKAREGVLDAKDYARNITAQRQKHAAQGAKVGVAGPMDVPVKHYARAFKPGKAQAAATLGGLGAVLAGDQIGRYRRNTGRPYNSLR